MNTVLTFKSAFEKCMYFMYLVVVMSSSNRVTILNHTKSLFKKLYISFFRIYGHNKTLQQSHLPIIFSLGDHSVLCE